MTQSDAGWRSSSPCEQPRTGEQQITMTAIDEQLAYVDGINGSAGHHLDDTYLREVVRQQIGGKITGDEARELGRKHLESGAIRATGASPPL